MHNLVSFEDNLCSLLVFVTCMHVPLLFADEPPKVINNPKSLSKVYPGTAVSFTVQATGTEPLSYQWQWKPAEEEGESEEWQLCRAEWSGGPTLTIPSVQKSNEGSYRCVISNYAGTQTSNSANLNVGKNPTIVWSTAGVIGLHYILTLGLFLHVAELSSTQQLDVLKMALQTAELERRLQEAEYQKQQAELEREMAVKEMEAQKKFQMQLHAQLGKS